jgi:hydroxypyruvate isomerase
MAVLPSKLAANLSFLFTDRPFAARIDAAAAAGFAAVECLFPYEMPLAQLASRLRTNGLSMALFNVPAGDWKAGERGLSILQDRASEFAEGLERAVDYALELACPRLHLMAGIVPAGADSKSFASLYRDRVAQAAARLGAANLTLLVEPISQYTMPGYFLTSTGQATEVIDAVGADNVRLQLDLFHCQASEGALSVRIRDLFPRIGHVQIAGFPERHEPDRGEVNYRYVLKLLAELGYDGLVGCEYHPAGLTEDGLGWIEDFGIQLRDARQDSGREENA